VQRNFATFDEVFETATGTPSYPFQRRFAMSADSPSLVSVPTGLGKTAMVVVGWLWRRFGGDGDLKRSTPRRLVYCLPMRVLVEQTRDCALDWLDAVGLLSGKLGREPAENGKRGRVVAHTYRCDPDADGKIDVHVLMGGEETDEWDVYPERDAIIIGTQDMLLSRALNRGYAASRARWPMQFGLLNTDCLWIFDEIQLMGAGLATTAQIEAFRRLLPGKDGHGCRNVWMSATLDKRWLETVDFKEFLKNQSELRFDFEMEMKDSSLSNEARQTLEARWTAKKPLVRAEATMDQADNLAKEILAVHKRATRTIVVVNTVKRACELFEALSSNSAGNPKNSKLGRKSKKIGELEKDAGAPVAPNTRLVLLHSRFRPRDRNRAIEQALADPPPDGTILVSTQVIEAGVDVSATTLFTELAPWASLVQRFGRCNRRGQDDHLNERGEKVSDAQIFWIDLPKDAKKAKEETRPYEPSALREAGGRLEKCHDVGLAELPSVKLLFDHTHVIRRKDLIDLFDTTPDLAGNDIDIDRYVREIEETDVRVFWRVWDGDSPPSDKDWRRIAREELCPAPIGEFRDFVKVKRGSVWRWDFLEGAWVRVDAKTVYPGQTYLINAEAGGYKSDHGWNPKSSEKVTPEKTESSALTDVWAEKSYDDEPLSGIGCWQTIAEHTDQVCAQISGICASLHLCEDERPALEQAVRWHDWGKVHHVFQNAIDDGQAISRAGEAISRRQRPNPWQGCRTVAKAPDKVWKNGRLMDSGWWRRYDWLPNEGRKHFRHELASALGVLGLPDGYIAADLRDLVAYLIAAHHGKVRLSIRSLPREKRPGNGLRFARGIWEGDELPAVELGGGVIAPALKLSLEPMELGLCEYEPFTGQPSWAERMTRLRDNLGPFNLSYLEAIMRAADMRASRAAEQREAQKLNHEADHQRKEAVRG